MKKLLMVLALMPLMALADTETVDGITWTFTVSGGTAEVRSGYYCSSAIPATTVGAINIPLVLGGKPVTSIGNYAFYSCSGLTSVTIPSSITSIGDSAFYYCSGLTAVTIPSGVTRIGSYAFEYCSGLKSMTIPKSVTDIGYSVFYGCTGIESITLPFVGSRRGNGGNFSSLFGSGSGSVPATLTKVAITDDSTLSSYAFQNCKYIENITLPIGVSSIGHGAFQGCESLRSISLPVGVSEIGSYAFQRCLSLTDMTIPVGVQQLESSVFEECLSLARVTLPVGLTTIGYGAFRNCRSLYRINIPNTVTSISSGAFAGCTGLGSGVVVVDKCLLSVNGNCPANVVIDKDVRLIVAGAFSECENLQSVTINAEIEELPDDLFEYCPHLKKVVLPASLRVIGYYAFYNCSALEGIQLPEGLIEIGEGAFARCSSIRTFHVPASVTQLGSLPTGRWEDDDWDGDGIWIPSKLSQLTVAAGNKVYAAYNNMLYSKSGRILLWCLPSATSVSIRGGTKYIAGGAFQDCSKLTQLTIPEGVVALGNLWDWFEFEEGYYPDDYMALLVDEDYLPDLNYNDEGSMFYGCSSLQKLSLPSTLASVDESAFDELPALSSLTVASGNRKYAAYDNVFYDKEENRLLRCLPALKTAKIWDKTESIASYAFDGCANLESLTVPASVKKIGTSPFWGCEKLKAVYYKGDAPFPGYSRRPCDPTSWEEVDEREDVDKEKIQEQWGLYLLAPWGGSCCSCEERHEYLNVTSYAQKGTKWWGDSGEWQGRPLVVVDAIDDLRFVAVKFKGNGGVSEVASREFVSGQPFGALPSATLEGQNFLGWYTAAEGGVRVTASTVFDGSFTKLYAHWASRKGSSPASAKALTVGPEEKSRSFPLTEEYDEEVRRGTGSGAYYHKVTLEKGKAYTFCLTDASEDCWLDVSTDRNDPTLAFFEHEWCAGIQAAFLYSDAWDKDDPDYATFYVYVGGAVGDTAVLHYSEGIVTDYFPKGSDLNPKVIDGVKIDYSRTLVYGEFYFNVWLDAGETYSIAVRDDGTNQLRLDCDDDRELSVVRRSDTGLEVTSDTDRYLSVLVSGKADRPFLFTSTKAFYWLTFDSMGGSPVEPLRYGYGLSMDGLPVPVREGYRFVRWRFAADNAKVKATTLMPAADTALVAQWTELGRPYFVTTSPKVYEDAGYAELQVVRTSGEGALSVRWTTADLTASAGVDYVASEGTLSWAQDDMEAKTVRVKLIPDLVGRYELAKKFSVVLSPLPAAEAASRGEYRAVLGEAAVATVKVKNVDAARAGAVTYVGGPLAVTAGEWLRVRVARTGGDDGRIAVKVKTQPGTALADVDYVHVSETLVWEDGEDGERELWVRTLDARSTGAKTFNVKLSAQTADAYADCALPEIPATKSYVTLNGTADPPATVKASFTVTGPGIFTASPYVATGTGRIKWKAADGWTVIGSSGTVNVKVPAGETTVQFKVIEASPDARLAFEPQVKGRDYRFITLTNPDYMGVAPDGSLVDSKGREVFFEKTYELTQGVFESVSEDFFGVDNPMTLVGGSVPTGMFTYVGGDDWMSGLCLAPCIEGVPVKAKDYVAVFRFTAGEYKKRIAILTFKVKAADLDFGNYYGVLRTEDPVSGFARFGWLKYSVAADGTVSAKATVGGVKHKSSDRCFDVGEGSRVPEIRTYSWDNGSQVDLVVDRGMATVRLGYGLPTYSCELHRAEADLADFAGYYTLALVPTDCCWREPPCGNGYLTLTVGADGSVVTAGKFPDGTDFTASSVAYRAGDALEIPVFAAVAPWSFGGVLRIRPDRTVELGKSYDASVFDSSAALDWYGSPFGYGGVLRLVPAGGYYNTVFNLQTYYLNRDFSIEAEGAPETALELIGNSFGPNATNTKLTFTRETGIVSGKFDNWQTGTRVRYYGVVPMYRDGNSPLSASAWATGFYLLPQPDGSVESRPFAINAE